MAERPIFIPRPANRILVEEVFLQLTWDEVGQQTWQTFECVSHES